MTIAISNYLALITSQYQNSPKFLAWLEAVLQIAHDVSVCADSIPAAFDLDTAVGVQLDVVGASIGQPRLLDFQPTGGQSAYLEDATYRNILKLKTMTNYWDGKIATIYDAWYKIFPDVVLNIHDNMDMTADVTITGSLKQIIIDMILRDLVLPRPEGVRYWYKGSIASLPLASYDMDDDYFKGYDEGYWDCSLT